MGRSNSASCPHCSSKARISTSKKVTNITREIYYQCTNIECGHTWASVLSAVRTIVPSRIPNPAVFIPQSVKTEAMQETTSPQSG
ncbi:transcriptional regulator [Methylotenera oryzisoli]|uniref:Transcriptional regulator n=1 Tax=Methylotenera oryzisoli TaxID=2080758 RepID=A0A4Y9VRK8_9PROT|nr:ogr/Delta-like zinc finger family protein [Methylotenera oryzisoli]TFW71492.1 transcriptional regulator [Methylotenera oryzisoli]